MLLFSATVPNWVMQTAEQYMSKDKVVVDLIGQDTIRTAVTVEHKAICCPYSERPATIADVIQVVCYVVWQSSVRSKVKGHEKKAVMKDTEFSPSLHPYLCSIVSVL